MSDENTTTEELAGIRREIREWGLGMRWVLVAMMVVPLYYTSRVLLLAPQFEKLFEDMLGSKEKLPLLTKMVIESPTLFLVAVWSISGVAVMLIFLMRTPRLVWVTAVLVTLSLVGTTHLIAVALFAPLGQVIQNLSGGGAG